MITHRAVAIDAPIISGHVSYTPNATDYLEELKPLVFAQVREAALSSVNATLTRLTKLAPDWDGNGSARPNLGAITKAAEFAKDFYRNARLSGYQWIAPHVSADESGDVSFEWWHNEHKLTVYVDPNSARYIQVWGEDIDHQMIDGPLERDRFLGLWRWLNA
jgi:hypothetical protein